MHQVGIDISKTKFDACLLLDDNKTKAKTFGNSYKGFHALMAWFEENEVTCVHVRDSSRFFDSRIEVIAFVRVLKQIRSSYL